MAEAADPAPMTSQPLASEDRDRARHRRWSVGAVLLAALVAAAVAAGAGLYGYDTSSKLAQEEVTRLNEQARVLHSAIAELRRSNQEMAAAMEVLELRELEWKQRFAADPSLGEEAELVDLIRRRRADGVEVERIKLAIGSIPVARACDPQRVSRRLTVAMPETAGGEPALFADDTIAVTAEGEPATDAVGNPLAWFEPAEPIIVRIARAGAETEEVFGVLPLGHSLVVEQSEYRFHLSIAGRGQVEVSFERCSFP